MNNELADELVDIKKRWVDITEVLQPNANSKVIVRFLLDNVRENVFVVKDVSVRTVKNLKNFHVEANSLVENVSNVRNEVESKNVKVEAVSINNKVDKNLILINILV